MSWITGLGTMIGKPILRKGVSVAWENRNYLSLLFRTKIGFYGNQDIRFSLSGIYRIRIPHTDKYLLVLNRRIKNQLQPVGGVYKRHGADELFESWGYKMDSAIKGLGVDEKSNLDLRFTVKGKYAIEVLKWFESGMGREEDPRREFSEELLDTGILEQQMFERTTHKRISKHLSWSEHFKCYEILVYDVFEFIPNEQQSNALIDLASCPVDLQKGYAIVSQDDIDQLRLMKDGIQIARIGEHSKLIINQSFK
jgi:hypothetical protein